MASPVLVSPASFALRGVSSISALILLCHSDSTRTYGNLDGRAAGGEEMDASSCGVPPESLRSRVAFGYPLRQDDGHWSSTVTASGFRLWERVSLQAAGNHSGFSTFRRGGLSAACEDARTRFLERVARVCLFRLTASSRCGMQGNDRMGPARDRMWLIHVGCQFSRVLPWHHCALCSRYRLGWCLHSWPSWVQQSSQTLPRMFW